MLQNILKHELQMNQANYTKHAEAQQIELQKYNHQEELQQHELAELQRRVAAPTEYTENELAEYREAILEQRAEHTTTFLQLQETHVEYRNYIEAQQAQQNYIQEYQNAELQQLQQKLYATELHDYHAQHKPEPGTTPKRKRPDDTKSETPKLTMDYAEDQFLAEHKQCAICNEPITNTNFQCCIQCAQYTCSKTTCFDEETQHCTACPKPEPPQPINNKCQVCGDNLTNDNYNVCAACGHYTCNDNKCYDHPDMLCARCAIQKQQVLQPLNLEERDYKYDHETEESDDHGEHDARLRELLQANQVTNNAIPTTGDSTPTDIEQGEPLQSTTNAAQHYKIHTESNSRSRSPSIDSTARPSKHDNPMRPFPRRTAKGYVSGAESEVLTIHSTDDDQPLSSLQPFLSDVKKEASQE